MNIQDSFTQRLNRGAIFKILRTVKNPMIEENSEETSTGSSYEEERNLRPMRQSKQIKKEKKSRRGQRSCWSQTEDQRVLELFQQHGPKWSKIAKLLENRKPKQVRDRYMNVLNPEIDHSPWTEEEDELFIELYQKFGKRWCLIAEHIPRRSENQAKNRYYWHLDRERLLSPKETVLSQVYQETPTPVTCEGQDLEKTEKDQSSNNESEFNEFLSHFEFVSDFPEFDLILNDHETDTKEVFKCHSQNIFDHQDLSISKEILEPQATFRRADSIAIFIEFNNEENLFQKDPYASLTFEEMVSMKNKTQ